MSDYEFAVWMGMMAVGSFVSSYVILDSLVESVKTGLKARYALSMIALGDNPHKYRWDIRDAEIDGLGLAGLIMGGRKALFRSVREGRRNLR